MQCTDSSRRSKYMYILLLFARSVPRARMICTKILFWAE